jgi:hypothetical protein
MRATVLAMKGGGTGEVVLILDGSPAVVTFKDIKFHVAGSRASVIQRGLLQKKLKQGTRVEVDEVGTWNVRTCALHGPKIHILNDEDEAKESLDPVIVWQPRRPKVSTDAAVSAAPPGALSAMQSIVAPVPIAPGPTKRKQRCSMEC